MEIAHREPLMRSFIPDMLVLGLYFIGANGQTVAKPVMSIDLKKQSVMENSRRLKNVILNIRPGMNGLVAGACMGL